MNKWFLRLVVLAQFLVFGQMTLAQAPPAKLTAERWQADLRLLAEELPRRHKNLFHTMTRAQFDAAVKQLDEKIPSLADHEITVGFMRLMAMVGDSHTRLNGMAARFRAGRYPMQLYLFKDGLFVRRIAAEHAEWAGAKVLRVGKLSAEEALSRVREIVPHDNEMGVKDEAPFWFVFPEVLHALGIADDLQTVKLVAEIDGQPKTLELKPVSQPPARWVDARDAAKTPVPLWLKNPGNDYWFEYLPEQKTIYVQFNVVRNKPDETVEAFFNRVFAFVTANPVDKFVLDLRQNGGGNNFLNLPIVKGVIRSKMDERGKFFAILGRETFSAAQNLVNQLEKYTNVIFVGEPTSGRPNHYGDARPLTLPNSGLVVRASTLWWQDLDPRDDRMWTAPQVAAEMTSADYRANRDPALEAILNYTPGGTIAQLTAEALAANDLTAFLKKYRQFKAAPANFYVHTGRAVNALGYQLMERNRLDDAITVFKLNTEAYPDSANAFDSLAEAYGRRGQREEAIKNYERALQLDPNLTSASEALRRLRKQ
ncbi:MAG: tetratricopeptide repeat protein [Acidobacteria bacterium]|nr:tetratricopeptide repeat protein [Acidobacteriota bacterium]